MKRRYDKKPELLAPAGDLMRAEAAIRFGADAVYLGGQKFSLRARASNFSMAEIREICAYAHAHHATVHVTVNMIPHEEDFDGLKEYLQQLEEAGVDAVIEASPAVMRLTHACAPGLAIHCSTQMSSMNHKSAELFRHAFGITRTVLARECTVEEIRALTEACPTETEVFIHGGMCVNISGRCTLSNRMTLRDANRGGCAQSCRWQYDVYDGGTRLSRGDEMFTMGSKDLMAAAYIRDLMKAGVTSFKIEGRMKTEYYVASVVSGYRHLIDDLYAHDLELPEARLLFHEKEILKGENREVCTGFLGGRAGRESIIYHENDNSHVNHDFLGMAESYDPEAHTMKFYSRNPFDRGDRLEILRAGKDNVFFTADWIRQEDGSFLEKSRVPMKLLEIPVPCEISEKDILRRAEDDTD